MGTCVLCPPCSSGFYRAGCTGTSSGQCTACPLCPISQNRFLCEGTSEGTCVTCLPTGFCAGRAMFRFDTRSGDYQLGPDGTVQYTGASAMPAMLGNVTVSTGTTTVNGQVIPRGMQIWTVGTTGWYDIVAGGASGADSLRQTGSYFGGRGVAVSTRHELTAGTVVVVAVGMKPTGCSNSGLYGAGGGTFVSRYAGTGTFATLGQHTLILAAGGGGSVGNNAGRDATTDTSGTRCVTNPATAVSSNGGGGGGGALAGGNAAVGSSSNAAGSGGGGGGFLAKGGDGYTVAGQETRGGDSFLAGGKGGDTIGSVRSTTACAVTGIASPGRDKPEGGFGGGGGAWNAGGGGGGYSGGQGCSDTQRQGGGGGGSYDSRGIKNVATLYSVWEPSLFGGTPLGYSAGFMSSDGVVSISLINCPENTHPSREFTDCLPNAGYYIGSSPTRFPPSPFMSASSFTSGGETFTATASSADEAAWRVFSGAETTAQNGSDGFNAWTAATASYPRASYNGTISTVVEGETFFGEWIQLRCSNAHALGTYGILTTAGTPMRTPTNFMMVGSNDGVTWYTLHVVTGVLPRQTSFKQLRTFETSTIRYMEYFRLIVTNTTPINHGSGADGRLSIDKLILYDTQLLTCNGTCATGKKFCWSDGGGFECCTSNQYFLQYSQFYCGDCPPNSAPDAYQERCVANSGFFGPTLHMFDGKSIKPNNLGSRSSHVISAAGLYPTWYFMDTNLLPYISSSSRGQYFKVTNDYNTITLAFWMYLDAPFNPAIMFQYEPAAMQVNSIGFNFDLGTHPSATTANQGVGFFYTCYGAGECSNALSVSGTFLAYTWTHVVLVIPNTPPRQHRMYKDGALVATSSATPAGNFINNFERLLLGANIIENRFFRGYLRQVAMYNYAMSAAEVTALYNAGAPHVYLACPNTCATGLVRHCLINGGTVCCPRGTFFRAEVDTTCQLCPAGTFSLTSASACTSCPAGKFNRDIPQITGVPTFTTNGVHGSCALTSAWLGSTQGWCALTASTNLYFLVADAGAAILIDSVTTQGRADQDQWVTAYDLAHSLDSTTWTVFGNLVGNTDRNTRVTRAVNVVARYLRFTPTAFSGWPSMRVGFSAGTSRMTRTSCQDCPANSNSNAMRTGCVANTGYYNLDRFLLAYFPFRPENIYMDASGNGYVLTDTNGPSFQPQSEFATGPFPGAGVAYFDNKGTNFAGVLVGVGSAESAAVRSFKISGGINLFNQMGTTSSPGTGFSLCAWMRGADGGTAGTVNTIGSTGGTQGIISFYSAIASTSSHKLRILRHPTIADISLDRTDTSSSGGFATGAGRYTRTWTHMCFVIVGRQVQSYYDCSSASCTPISTTWTLEMSNAAYTFAYLGQQAWDYPFFGWLSDVRLYRKALTPAEVFAVRSYAAAPPFRVNETSSLLAYYPFNQANIYADASGNGFTLANTIAGHPPVFDSATTSPFPGAGVVYMNNNAGVTALSGNAKTFRIQAGSGFDLRSMIGTSATPAAGFSVCFWYRAQDGSSTPGTVNTVEYMNGFSLGNTGSTGNYIRWIRNAGTTSLFWSTVMTANNPAAIGEFGATGVFVRWWTHACFTYSGRTLINYYNCSSPTCPATGTVTMLNDIPNIMYKDVFIGQHQWDPVWYGWFSEVRLYRKALTPSEVFAIRSFDGTNPTGVESVNNGLLAYYPFHPNAFLVDASNVTGSLIPTGSPAFTPGSLTDLRNGVSFAQPGGLLATSANTLRQFFTIPSIRIGPSFSICAWYNPDSTSGSFPRIIELSNGRPSDNIGIRRNLANNDLAIEVWNGGTTLIPGNAVVYTGLFQLGVWQHVCLTVAGTTARVYYNGAQNAVTITLSAQKTVTTYTGAFIGHNPYDNDLYRGLIDEVRIYSRAISAAEVTSIFNFRGETFTSGIFIPCPAGTFQDIPDGTACLQCTRGKYSLAAAATCISCSGGSISAVDGASACTPCGSGTFAGTEASACTPCSPGSFSLAGAATCLPCSGGSFSGPGVSVCTPCAAGSFSISGSSVCGPCAAGGYSSNGASQCTPCPAGSYLTGTGMLSSGSCLLCEPGKFSSVSGRGTPCDLCSAGFYFTGSGLLFHHQCLRCGAGAFSTASGEVSAACSSCPAGTFSTGLALSNVDQCPQCENGAFSTAIRFSGTCTKCQGGTYSSGFGMPSSSTCLLCGSGTYSTFLGAVSVFTCQSCLGGTFQTGSGLVSSASCVLCKAGSFSTALGAVSSGVCQDCDAGTYSTGSGIRTSAGCLLCNSGTYSTSLGAISPATCLNCFAGSYFTGSGLQTSAACVNCDSGTFSTTLGAISSLTCRNCPAGTFNPTFRASNCSFCDAGKFSSGGNASCSDCDAGRFSRSNSSFCSVCVAGTHSPNASSPNCTNCPAGTFQDMLGASLCLNCPTGKYSDKIGSNGPQFCVNCPIGSYSEVPGITSPQSCLGCSSGLYSTIFGSNQSSNCIPCEPGTYSMFTGSGSRGCIQCVSGKFSTATGRNSALTCQDCIAGTFSTGAGMQDNATCVLCNPGTFSTGSGGNTSLTCRNCAAGTYSTGSGLQSNASCQLCHTGTFSTASGANTSLTCLNCFAGTYNTGLGGVSSAACMLCNPGTFSTSPGANSSLTCRNCLPGSYSTGSGIPVVYECSPCTYGTFSTASGASSSLTCQNCEAGTFGIILGAPSNDSCYLCIFGAYSTALGASSESTCQYCVAGSYSSAFGAISNATCVLCNQGTYLTEAGGGSSLMCEDCPAGTYSTTSGASTASACTACDAGAYSTGTGSSSSPACLLCQPGKFSTSTGAFSPLTCENCTAGTYSSGLGSQSSTGCVSCNPGLFSTAIGAISISACQTCPAGTYVTGSGLQGSADCVRCLAGQFSTALGAISSSACQGCPAGSYSNVTGLQGSAGCIRCLAGQYSTTLGAPLVATCQLCPAGTFFTGTGLQASAACTGCNAGQYSTNSGAVSSGTCQLCLAGTYFTGMGLATSSACQRCNPGQFSTALGAVTLSTCGLCSAGTYSSFVGGSTCSACSPGTYSALLGAIDVSSCQSCSAGAYHTGSGAPSSGSCVLCPQGTYSSALGASTSLTCSLCAAGTFQSMLGAPGLANCLACPAGRYSTATGAPTSGTCVLCAAGRFSTSSGAASNATCAACNAGTYATQMQATGCLSCPSNSFTGGAGASQRGDCLCNPGFFGNLSRSTELCSQCPANSYCAGLFRFLCPINTFSAPQSSLQSHCRCVAGYRCRYGRDIQLVMQFNLTTAAFALQEPAIRSRIAALAGVPVSSVSLRASLPVGRRLLEVTARVSPQEHGLELVP